MNATSLHLPLLGFKLDVQWEILKVALTPACLYSSCTSRQSSMKLWQLTPSLLWESSTVHLCSKSGTSSTNMQENHPPLEEKVCSLWRKDKVQINPKSLMVQKLLKNDVVLLCNFKLNLFNSIIQKLITNWTYKGYE